MKIDKMLFENQLNKTATPSNKINLNSSFSSVSNSTPRPLNTNNYSTLNSPWNNNIKKVYILLYIYDN